MPQSPTYHLITCGTSLLSNLKYKNPVFNYQNAISKLEFDHERLSDAEYKNNLFQNLFYGVLVHNQEGSTIDRWELSNDAINRKLGEGKKNRVAPENLPLLLVTIQKNIPSSANIKDIQGFTLCGGDIRMVSFRYNGFNYTILTNYTFPPQLVLEEFLELFETFSEKYSDEIDLFKTTGEISDNFQNFHTEARMKIKNIIQLYLDKIQIYRANYSSEKLIEYAFHKLENAPRVFSAELNSLWEFVGDQDLIGCTLLTTDTPEGSFCGQILSKYIEEKFSIPTRVYRINQFGKENIVKGNLNLKNKIMREVERIHSLSSSPEIYFNVTGGFKPEAAMVQLLGSLYHIRCYYIYETTKNVVILPSFPLGMEKAALYDFLLKFSPPLIMKKKRYERFIENHQDEYDVSLKMNYIKDNQQRNGSNSRKLELTPNGKLYVETAEDFQCIKNQIEY